MTREIEARLKLSAMDRTAAAFKSVSGRMSAIDAKARAVTAASGRMAALQAGMIARAAGVLAPAVIGAAAAKSFTHFAEMDRRLTRIGMTADASDEQMSGMRSTLSSIARETATPIDQVTSGLEDLVAQGKSLPEALAFLPSVTRTAAASGAEVKDMAASTGALADSLRISSGEMQRAFDVLVAGGKAGKFELKDMSQYLPSLAPAAAAVGMRGMDGLRRVTAMLQIVRNQTGSASEAATNLTNVFQKMESDETAKRFKKFGVDLRKEMVTARKDGRELTEVFLDLSERALKGDLSKIPQLFSDMQMAGGMRALLSQRDGLKKLQAALNDVDGATMRDLAKVTDDAQASVDRLANSWDRFVTTLGRTVDDMGASKGLDRVTRGMDDRLAQIEAERRAPGSGGREERIRQMVSRGVSRAEAEKLVKADESFGFGDAPLTTAERDRLASVERAGSVKRVATARADLARLDKIRARYGSEPMPPALQAQYEAAKRVIDLEPRDYGQRFAPPVDRARLAAGEAQRFRGAPEALPMPRPRPSDFDALPMPRARPDPVSVPAKLDDAALDSEVQRLRARLQSNLDANPLVLRTRVQAAPLPSGRSFQGGEFSGAP